MNMFLITMIYNVSMGAFKLAIIKLPGYGTSKELYYDAIINKLGKKSIANKVICSMSECIIVSDGNDTSTESEN